MTTGDVTRDILRLACIRSFVDANMPEGMYFDVFEIKLPSKDGDYSEYEAIVPASSKEDKKKLEELFNGVNAKVAIVIF